MAFSITCPSCSAKLKTATAIPIGRNVACPKCKSNFAVTADIMEEVADTKTIQTAPAAAAKATTPAAAAKTAPSPAKRTDDDDDDRPRKKRDDDDDDAPRSRKVRDDDDDDRPKKKGSDDDDDDRPRSRKGRDDDDDRPKKKGRDDDDDAPRSRKGRDEDDDDRPKKKGRDEDDDDKPRSRKKRDEDEDDDDKPKKKKARDEDDDDDDKPRSRKKRDDDDDDRPKRKGRDDDDDDDDRPRKKKKKKSKKGPPWVLIGIGVGGVAAVVGIVFLIMSLLGGGYDKEMVALMPSETTSMNYTNVDKLLDNAKIKKSLEKEFNGSPKYAIFKTAGMAVGDIKSTLEGSAVKRGGGKNNFGGGDQIEVVRFKKSVDKGKITSGGTESKAGSKSYWKLKDGGYIAFPSDDLVVMCGSEDTIKTILNKEEGKVVISETLQSLAKKVGGGDVWFANAREGDAGAMDFPGMDEAMKIRMKAKGSATRMDISSSSLSSTSYTLCDSDENAQKLLDDDKKKWEEGKGKLEEQFTNRTKFGGKAYTDAQKEAIKKAYMGMDFSKSGAFVESSRTIDTTAFTDEDGPGFLF